MFGLIEKGIGLIGKIIGGDKVKDVAAAIAGNPEVKAELQKLEQEAEASLREMYKTEIVSEDKFVRRARPSLLWLITVIIGINYILVPGINAVLGAIGRPQVVLIYPELPESVYWLFGAIFSVYTGARSFDKSKSKK